MKNIKKVNNTENLDTNKTKEEKLKNTDLHEKCKFLVSFFLKDTINCKWPNEIKNAKLLLGIHSDIEFWTGINLQKKLNTLVFFKTVDGQVVIENQKKKYTFSFPESTVIQIENTKFGETKTVNISKSLLENLNTK